MILTLLYHLGLTEFMLDGGFYILHNVGGRGGAETKQMVDHLTIQLKISVKP